MSAPSPTLPESQWCSIGPNSGCPYVGKHYESGTMQALQKKETADGVVWLTVSSSAPDTQGYFTAPTARTWAAKERWAGTAILLDSAGKIGRDYGAKNTPHMFVIDKAGRIAYMGGIDDRPYADPASLKRRKTLRGAGSGGSEGWAAGGDTNL